MMAAKGKNSKRVLIIEDDVFLMKAYEIRFENEGVEVVMAADADEARKQFSKKPTNAVLLDLMLPGTSGFELLQEMKKLEGWKDVPVIIVSNLSQDKDIATGKKLGAVDYIVKADFRVGEVVQGVISKMK